MSNFAAKIKDLEARILRLKTLGLKSSSSLAAASQQITIPNNGARAVHIIVNTNKSALVAAYMVSPTTLVKDAVAFFRLETDENHRNIVALGVFDGYTVDGYKIEVMATSTFTYSLEWPQ